MGLDLFIRLPFPSVTHIGPLAAIRCKPRQARKGATVATDSGAEVRLGGLLYFRRGGRVVEGARLESVYGATHRGFESLPLRHTPKFMSYMLCSVKWAFGQTDDTWATVWRRGNGWQAAVNSSFD